MALVDNLVLPSVDSKGELRELCVISIFCISIPQQCLHYPLQRIPSMPFNYNREVQRNRLDVRLPPPKSRVRVSVIPCGFRDGRKGIWVGFSRAFSRFPLAATFITQFPHTHLIRFIGTCDGASGVVGRNPCYSLTFNVGSSSHLIPRPGLVSDMS